MNLRNLAAPALAAALCTAAATSHALPVILISEGFDNAGTPSTVGWSTQNLSSPTGTSDWSAGNDTVFAAQAGDSTSYTAVSYTSAAAGGTLSDWLISPSFSNATAVQVTLYARAAGDLGYIDQLSFGFSSGAAAPASFSMSAPQTIASDSWTSYTFYLAAGSTLSTARFAVQYVGSADAANYVGIDSVTITAVPETSTWLLMGAGLTGVAAWRRRQAA